MMELVLYHETHLELTDKPAWDQAMTITSNLDVMGRNIQWWMGDWLNLCERIFGERYAQLIPDAGWNAKSLQNWKWVAAKISPERRINDLTWSHHEAVAGLNPDQQSALLAAAAQEALTVMELRKLTKEMQGKIPASSVDKPKLIKCADCDQWITDEEKGCPWCMFYIEAKRADVQRQALISIRDNDIDDVGVALRATVDIAIEALEGDNGIPG